MRYAEFECDFDLLWCFLKNLVTKVMCIECAMYALCTCFNGTA